MLNPTEQSEREYLEEIKERLYLALKRIGDRVREYTEEMRHKKQYIYEHQHGMDEADHVAAGQSLDRMASTGENAVARRRKLLKLVSSPYFGRIDFRSTTDERETPVYIGIATFTDDSDRLNIIYDWRAPISSMFYDFELGDAFYDTPGGKVNGTIWLKRQYKIMDGKMEFMIENAVSIHDEVLQRELSKSADDKMKNIVATIQRDQNQVIRNETAQVMIIQGVAGSGKTSIALHRIAFLLYRYRDSIKSKDILIISPNKVFADYIGNVLPELGEEHIPEMGMEDLATELLDNKFVYQTFFEQVAVLLEHPQPDFIERIKFKSSFEFVRELNKYFIHLENNSFNTDNELKVAGVIVPFPFIIEKFRSWSRMPMHLRIPEVTKEVLQYIRNKCNRKLSGREKGKVWESIPRMFNMKTPFEVYRDFFTHINEHEMFRMMPGQKLEWSDVFPLIYCKLRLEGAQSHDHIKHLLVDEMQDYTPIQYAVLSRVFKCKKTILGDVNQPVNPYSSSSAEGIEEVFPTGEIVKLLRSYRSTVQIVNFSLRVCPNPDLIAMERQGEQPQVNHFTTHEEEVEAIRTICTQFTDSKHHSLGIICKTQRQASELFKDLTPTLSVPKDIGREGGASQKSVNRQTNHKGDDDSESEETPSPLEKGQGLPAGQAGMRLHLLTPESTAFTKGIIITTTHLSKGLEFDEVIVPFVSATNYKTDIDKRMLYIACTRAMHRLTLTHTGEDTSFIK